MQGLIALDPPSGEPVTLAEAKAHLRLTGDGEDEIVSRLIVLAREAAEYVTGRAFVAQSFRLTLDRWPARVFLALPRPPLRAVTAVRIFAADGQATLWDGYRVDTAHTPGRLCLAESAQWPPPGRPLSGIEIDFEAGYGAPEDVPAALRQAVLIGVAHYFENREAVAQASYAAVPGLAALLQSYRVRML